MKFENFTERLHQLNVIDRNALEVYSDLAKGITHEELLNTVKELMRDEARHVRLENEIFSLLEKRKSR